MKGQITGMQEVITLLVTVGLLSVIALIPKGQLTELSPELEAKEFENKALLLANSLLGDSNLIYSNNRAMFDEQQLNTKIIEKSSAFENMALCTPLCGSFNSYPESFGVVLIKDIERNLGWFSVLWHPKSASFNQKVSSCLSKVDKSEAQQLFDEQADIPSVLDLKNCDFQRYTSILTANFKVGDKIISNSFSVSIKDSSDNVHAGWIKVLVVE